MSPQPSPTQSSPPSTSASPQPDELGIETDISAERTHTPVPICCTDEYCSCCPDCNPSSLMNESLLNSNDEGQTFEIDEEKEDEDDDFDVIDVIFLVEESETHRHFFYEMFDIYGVEIAKQMFATKISSSRDRDDEEETPESIEKCCSNAEEMKNMPMRCTVSICTYVSSDTSSGQGVAAEFRGTYIDMKSLKQCVSDIVFEGGLSEVYTRGNEGLAIAIDVAQGQRISRSCDGLKTKNVIVLFAHLPFYDIPIIDERNEKWHMKGFRDLIAVLQRDKIFFCVITSSRIPFFIELYERANSIMVDVQKHHRLYEFSARRTPHFALLRGLKLPRKISEERVNFESDKRRRRKLAEKIIRKKKNDGTHIGVMNDTDLNRLNSLVNREFLNSDVTACEFIRTTMVDVSSKDVRCFISAEYPSPVKNSSPSKTSSCDAVESMVNFGGDRRRRRRGRDDCCSTQPTGGEANLSNLLTGFGDPISRLSDELKVSRKVVWCGQIRWQEDNSTSLLFSSYTHTNFEKNRFHTIRSELSIPVLMDGGNEDESLNFEDVLFQHWDSKIYLQMVSKKAFQKIGSRLISESRCMLLHPQYGSSSDVMAKCLLSGFVGCGHVADWASRQSKILIFVYSMEKRLCSVLLPENQESLIQSLNKVMKQELKEIEEYNAKMEAKKKAEEAKKMAAEQNQNTAEVVSEKAKGNNTIVSEDQPSNTEIIVEPIITKPGEGQPSLSEDVKNHIDLNNNNEILCEKSDFATINMSEDLIPPPDEFKNPE